MKVTQINDPIEALRLCKEGKMVFFLYMNEKKPGPYRYSRSLDHKTVYTSFKRLDLTNLRNINPLEVEPHTAYVLVEDVPEYIANAWLESLGAE